MPLIDMDEMLREVEPTSPATSIPAGPPPEILILLAVGSTFRKFSHSAFSSFASPFSPSNGEEVEAPVAMTKA